MNNNRRDALIASLKNELAVIHGNSAKTQRLIWICERVEEYIDRWLGFCDLPIPSKASLIISDLFVMIGIGTEVLENEILTNGFLERTYGYLREFRNCLKRIQDGDLELATRLMPILCKIKNMIVEA